MMGSSNLFVFVTICIFIFFDIFFFFFLQFTDLCFSIFNYYIINNNIIIVVVFTFTVIKKILFYFNFSYISLNKNVFKSFG